MPRSRHNAVINIIYETDVDPFTIFLSGFGNPDNVKSLLKLSVRGERRLVRTDPERMAVNLFYFAHRQTIVHLTHREKAYEFTYYIDLTVQTPTIRIKSGSADETFHLFPFLGSERRVAEKPHPAEKRQDYGKRRRGRPSGLEALKSQGYLTPAPDYIPPDGEPVFNITPKKKPLKINLRDAEKYAPKK